MNSRLRLSFLLLASPWAVPLFAADGDLDPGFWSDGRFLLPGVGFHTVNSVLAAPDERVVFVATETPVGGLVNWHWRAVGDSAADPSCRLSSPGNETAGAARAAAFDSAGRLLVAGIGNSDGIVMAVGRFLYPECVLDETFHFDGYWILDIPGGIEEVTAIAVDPVTGRIALGGHHDDSVHLDGVVALLSDSGNLVPGFSGNGWLTYDYSPGELADDRVAGVAFTAAGKVLAAGTSYVNIGADWIVQRFTTAGALDSTFSGDGRARVAFDLMGTNSGDDQLYGFARDPNTGDLLLCGSAQSPNGHSLAIARLLFNGNHDSTFSGNGKFELTFGDANSRLQEIAVDGLGRTLVAGFLDYPSSDADYIALRLLDGGTLDPTFGFSGLSLIEFEFGPGTEGNDYGRALTFQAGRLVVAGEVGESEIGESLPGLARLEVSLIFGDGFESNTFGQWSSSTAP